MALQEVPKITKYLSVIMLFGWLGRSTVWNFLPVYFETHIESVFLIGLLTSLPALVSVLLDIPVSNYVQRVGEKFVFFTGLLMAIMPSVFYLTAAPIFLVTGKFFEGVTKSLVWNSGWSLSMKSSGSEKESESLSVFLLGVNLAAVIGPVVGGYLLFSQGFNLLFGLWILASAISVMLFITYIGASTEANKVRMFEKLFKSKTYSNDIHHVKENWKSIKEAYGLIFLHSIIFSFFWLAIPLALEEAGATYIEMGLIFGFAATPKIFQVFFGGLADKIGRHETLILLSSILAPVLLGMYYFDSIIMLGGLFFVSAAVTNGMSPAIHSIFDRRAPEEVESELIGFMETFKHLGQLVGPAMAGAIASVYSLSVSFAFASFISVLILIYSVKLYRF